MHLCVCLFVFCIRKLLLKQFASMHDNVCECVPTCLHLCLPFLHPRHWRPRLNANLYLCDSVIVYLSLRCQTDTRELCGFISELWTSWGDAGSRPVQTALFTLAFIQWLVGQITRAVLLLRDRENYISKRQVRLVHSDQAQVQVASSGSFSCLFLGGELEPQLCWQTIICSKSLRLNGNV